MTFMLQLVGMRLPPAIADELNDRDVSRFGSAMRQVQVAEVEIRLRASDYGGAWRIVISFPTGQCAR